MNPLLVAMIVHFLKDPATLLEGGTPVYVVPSQPFGMNAQEPLVLSASDSFGPVEREKWMTVPGVRESRRIMAELCYPAAYNRMKREVDALKPADRNDVLVKVGGYHTLARVGVVWCNNSVQKLDVLPLRHREFAVAEKSVREAAYVDDITFLRSLKGPEAEAAAKTFAKSVIGVGLEAQ